MSGYGSARWILILISVSTAPASLVVHLQLYCSVLQYPFEMYIYYIILDYTRRARVAPKELFVLSGHPNSLHFVDYDSRLWIMLIIWVMTYFWRISKILRFLQILPNFALFWQNLRDSKGFRGGGGRTDGRTHTLFKFEAPLHKKPLRGNKR